MLNKKPRDQMESLLQHSSNGSRQNYQSHWNAKSNCIPSTCKSDLSLLINAPFEEFKRKGLKYKKLKNPFHLVDFSFEFFMQQRKV